MGEITAFFLQAWFQHFGQVISNFNCVLCKGVAQVWRQNDSETEAVNNWKMLHKAWVKKHFFSGQNNIFISMHTSSYGSDVAFTGSGAKEKQNKNKLNLEKFQMYKVRFLKMF